MNNFFKTCLSASFMLLASTCFFAQAKRWYVDSTAISSSNPDGSSWQRAFPDLQQALKVAKAGDSIWVAKGTYYPTSGLDQNVSFKVPNGVILMGGFKGLENHLEQRNWQANPSVLSGNIGSKTSDTDNAYHVMELISVDSSSLIDGFWIERGVSTTPGNNLSHRGGGIMIMANSSLFISNPRIGNCVFQYNSAIRGGAISLTAGNRIGRVKMYNCSFYNNTASLGGAIFIESRDLDGSFELNNCTFKTNHASQQGPCMYSALNGNLTIRNCNFEENESQRGGGAISIAGNLCAEDCVFTKNNSVLESLISINAPFSINPVKAKLWVKRTSFIANTANVDVGLISFAWQNDEPMDILFQQCSFKNNKNTLDYALINMVNGGRSKLFFQIDRCIFEGNGTNGRPRKPDLGMINIFNNADIAGGVTGTISNCVFLKNDRPFTIHHDNLGPTRISILNSTFIGNKLGAIIKRDRNPSQQAEVYLQNNIFYENAAELSSILQSTLRPTLSGFHFNHNLFSVPSCKTSTDTLGCGIGNIFGQYPKFVDSSSVSGLQLVPGSMAINAGRWHPELPALDLAGQQRVQDCKVDLGAYESPSILPVQDSLSAKAQIRSTPINQSLGEIGVQQITGGFPPYRLLWENGDTVRTRRNLAAGSYTLTLSDQQGCFKNYRFVVPFTTGLRDRVAQGTISLAPNPVPTWQPIKLFYQDIEPGNWELQLLDLTGKQLRNSRINLSTQGEMPIQLDTLPKGVYLLRVSKDRQVFNHKFVIL